jgi:hypothetical protein
MTRLRWMIPLVLLAGCGKPEAAKDDPCQWHENGVDLICVSSMCPKSEAAWQKYFKSRTEADLAAARKTTDEDWCYAADAHK